MNKAVDLDAQTPASVAANFLVAKGLLPEGAGGLEVEKLLIAADPGVEPSSETARALRAIRAGFTGSDLEISNTNDPLGALSDGTARVAMVGAESFYALGDDGPVARDDARAFASARIQNGAPTVQNRWHHQLHRGHEDHCYRCRGHRFGGRPGNDLGLLGPVGFGGDRALGGRSHPTDQGAGRRSVRRCFRHGCAG